MKENKIETTDDFDGIFWMKINSDYHWQVVLYEAQFGDKEVRLTNSPSSIIFDTGSSLIYIPTQEYIAITNMIFEFEICSLNKEDEFIYCPCSANLESLNAYPTL